MTDSNEIYKIMNEEFMGHKVDTVIIAKPFETPTINGVDIFRQYAQMKLEKELGLYSPYKITGEIDNVKM